MNSATVLIIFMIISGMIAADNDEFLYEVSSSISSPCEVARQEAQANASKSITSQPLTGFTADQIHIVPSEDGRYEDFILARLPVGDARAALDNALAQEEELYVKSKEHNAFEELQNELNRIGENN